METKINASNTIKTSNAGVGTRPVAKGRATGLVGTGMAWHCVVGRDLDLYRILRCKYDLLFI